MTTLAAWTNGVKAERKGEFFAVRLELMVGEEDLASLRKLLLDRKKIQHPVWISDTDPAPASIAAASITPESAPVVVSATPSKGWGAW